MRAAAATPPCKVAGALTGQGADDTDDDGGGGGRGWVAGQEPALLGLLAAELGVDQGRIRDWELTLFDTQVRPWEEPRQEEEEGGGGPLAVVALLCHL